MNNNINADFVHLPVMLGECIDALEIKPDGIYIDGTAGGGSHSAAILAKLGENGSLICIDRDDEAIATVKARFATDGRVSVIKDNFTNAASVLDGLGIDKFDGLLLDLGVSSHQLDTPERGFSYRTDAPLDMRMDTGAGITAADVVNGYSERELTRIIFDYGEEKFAGRVARRIVAEREKSPITTTLALADIVKSAIPTAKSEAQHPARRTFQAIRIEVNGELDAIAPALTSAADRLNTGGRIAVMTFHSLEDRIVKNTFAELCTGCTCPRDFPVCVCGKTPLMKPVTKKPTTASEREINENFRSHSAKLRAVEKL